jgi:tetratricopeptide (TPR) repeat protein
MSVPMSNETRQRVALMAARYHFSVGSWGTTLGLLPLAGDSGDVGLDAKILRAVALAQQSRYPEALPPLLAAYEQSKRSGRTKHQLATLALNIARTFFAAGNFGRAMEYYGKVGRDDTYWPQAHFERAWAHFRIEDMAGTIGLLHTHGSPFFDGWYFPEADLLRAQSLFLMCKFPEAVKSIDSFQESYTPVQAQLGETIGTMTPADAFEDGRGYLEGKNTKLPTVTLRKLGWNDRFQDAVKSMDLAQADLEKLDKLASHDLRGPAMAATQQHQEKLRSSEGERILDEARSATADLADMLQGIELTRIDLLTLEADMYSRAASTGKRIEFEDPIGKLRKLKKKGWQVWPFQGEYWADELGWYKVTGRPECPSSMQRGEG